MDLILTDLPYGTTRCKWDNIIPFEPMWDCVNQLTYERTPVLFFGSEPFSSHLRLSNIKKFKYDLIWNKRKGTNFLNANRMPLPCHEVISVFYDKLPCYNPQKRYVGVKSKRSRGIETGGTGKCYGKVNVHTKWVDDGYRFPVSVIDCDKSKTEARNGNNIHSTQKPVRLLEWLIKTYSKEGDVVLDFTMGSGSTGVACQNTNRDFIGIELDKEYYDIACERINNYQERLI